MRLTLDERRAWIARWTYATETARVTGRVIFGQLWEIDPEPNDFLLVTYAEGIADELNRPSPLMQMLAERR